MTVLGKTRLNIADQNSLLNQISNTYNNFYRAAMEYIDNSIDIAAINKENGIYHDYKIDIEIDTIEKSVSFLDNCGGMTPEELCGLLANVGLSKKKALPWANGQFGFGVHAFRAFAAEAIFISKKNGNPACKITIDRNKTERDEVECIKVPDNILLEEGTRVIISKFDRRVFRRNEFKKKLINELSMHFDDVLKIGLIRIFISEDNHKKNEILPFDYSVLEGVKYPRKAVEIQHNNGISIINIDLKILDQPQKNRLPIICSKGRRIQAIVDLQSYKNFLNSRGKNNYIWGTNEFIVGSIEINDFCSPNITRDDLSNCEERELLYEQLLFIQEEIDELFEKKIQSENIGHLNEISNKLTNCLNSVMKNFRLTFEIQRSSQISGDDDKQSIVDTAGIGWGGELAGGSNTETSVGNKDNGKEVEGGSSTPGNAEKGSGGDDSGLTEIDGNSKQVTTKSNAPKIEIKPFPDNKSIRVIDAGNTLYINTSHIDFKHRNSGTEDLPIFNSRLNNYISFIISPEIIFKLQKGKRLTEKELTENVIKLALKLEEHINKENFNY